MVHDADQWTARLQPPQPPVDQRQRWMVQLVLQENVHGKVAQAPVQAQREVVGQMRRVAAPGERHDLDGIAGLTQMLDQLAVVEIAAGERRPAKASSTPPT